METTGKEQAGIKEEKRGSDASAAQLEARRRRRWREGEEFCRASHEENLGKGLSERRGKLICLPAARRAAWRKILFLFL